MMNAPRLRLRAMAGKSAKCSIRFGNRHAFAHAGFGSQGNRKRPVILIYQDVMLLSNFPHPGNKNDRWDRLSVRLLNAEIKFTARLKCLF